MLKADRIGLVIVVASLLVISEPSAWLGDLEQIAGPDRFIEFHAPLFQEGDLTGFVRLGYFYPSARLSLNLLQ